MMNFVEKYTQDFPAHRPECGVVPRGCVVLITGTTGAIGSNTLAKLYESPDVFRIVVLARKSTTPIFAWQKKALEDRGLDPKIVDSPKIVLLEGDPALPSLGLGDDILLDLRSTVTHFLHVGM
jgi:thioester reductase-like protein